MACFRILSEADADDVMKDWGKYCAARGMALGVLPGEGTHTIAVFAETHRFQVTVGSPCEAAPDSTLDAYLRDYVRRHPSVSLSSPADEQALLAGTQYEGAVGFAAL